MVTVSKKNKIISEVAPLVKANSEKRKFVVHRHLGSILHYDLRIQINGVLKSWAIPSGPSMNPGDRRLAVAVSDQPLSYSSYKSIDAEEDPQDGLIEIWDKGTCIPHVMYGSTCSDQDIVCQLNEGRIAFTLKGKKLKGVFVLLRIDERSRHWLLIKGNDKFAVDFIYNCEAFTSKNSKINEVIKQQNIDRELSRAYTKGRTYE